MARQQIFYGHSVPRSVAALVSALCADYERRARLLQQALADSGVYRRYQELNAAIDLALDEIEVAIRHTMLSDVSAGRGFGKSDAQYVLSKNAYYRRRRRLIFDIAKNLELL